MLLPQMQQLTDSAFCAIIAAFAKRSGAVFDRVRSQKHTSALLPGHMLGSHLLLRRSPWVGFFRYYYFTTGPVGQGSARGRSP